MVDIVRGSERGRKKEREGRRERERGLIASSPSVILVSPPSIVEETPVIVRVSDRERDIVTNNKTERQRA